MSILIKGIDMPKSKDEALMLLILGDGTVAEKIGTNRYEEILDTQAIQIDRPHGRIGDLDGVIKRIDKSPTFASKYKGTAKLFINVYSDSNTILEAEE